MSVESTGQQDAQAERPAPPPGAMVAQAAVPEAERRAVILDRPVLVLALLAALVFPWIFPSPYILGVMILIYIFAVFNQSWNLVLGFSGIFSFGHLALFGVGAYTTALLGHHYGVSPYFGTLAGAFAAVAASLAMGLPSLRLRGVYVVLFTLGFHEIMRNLIVTDTTGYTGGGFGIYNYGQYGLEELDPLSRARSFYYVSLFLLVIISFAIAKAMSSPIGLALRSLRDSEAYAVSRGVPAYRYRVLVFTLSAFFAGLIGAFYAHYLNAVSPSILGFGVMMTLLAMIVIGGWGTYWGPLIGTFTLSWLTEALRDIGQWRQLFFGTVMVLFVVLVRGGLVRLLGDFKNGVESWIDEWLEETAEEEPSGG